MQWRKIDAWHYKSSDGYYISIAGPAGCTVYTAWVPGKWRGFKHKPVLYVSTGDEQEKLRQCVEVCRQHREQGEKDAA